MRAADAGFGEKTATLEEIQSLLKYSGPVVPNSAMRVTACKG